MWAMRIQACALAIDLSQSFDRRRQRPSPAKVRSTTHRLGETSKPCAVSERLTICTVQRLMTFRAARSLGPAEPHVRKDMAQHGIARGDSLQHIQRAVTILNPGALDLEPYEQSGRIGTNVALAVLALVPLTFRSPNSFMQPFVQRPRGFFHPVRSVAVLDYRTR